MVSVCVCGASCACTSFLIVDPGMQDEAQPSLVEWLCQEDAATDTPLLQGQLVRPPSTNTNYLGCDPCLLAHTTRLYTCPVYTRTHTDTHAHTHAHSPPHTHAHARTHSRMHTRTHSRTHTRTHALTHSRTHARTTHNPAEICRPPVIVMKRQIVTASAKRRIVVQWRASSTVKHTQEGYLTPLPLSLALPPAQKPSDSYAQGAPEQWTRFSTWTSHTMYRWSRKHCVTDAALQELLLLQDGRYTQSGLAPTTHLLNKAGKVPGTQHSISAGEQLLTVTLGRPITRRSISLPRQSKVERWPLRHCWRCCSCTTAPKPPSPMRPLPTKEARVSMVTHRQETAGRPARGTLSLCLVLGQLWQG